MLKMTTLFTCAVVAGLATAPALAETIDMATPYPERNFMTRSAQNFVARAVQIAGGGLTIKLHPNGSLIPGSQIADAVSSGKVIMGQVLMSNMETINTVFDVDSLPFVVDNYIEARKLWESARKPFNKALVGKNLTIIYAVPWPPQGLYTNKEINSASDLKGVKVRTYNAVTDEMATLMGAVPVRVEAADVEKAFKDGQVEAMFSSATTGIETNTWTFTKYFYSTQAWFPKTAVIVNTAEFEKLSEESRTAILNAAQIIESESWDESEVLAQSDRKELTSRGMTVVVPSDALRAEMEPIGKQLYKNWLKRAGNLGAEVQSRFKYSH